MRVSHETIYLSLFVQSRGVLKKALMATSGSRTSAAEERRGGGHNAVSSRTPGHSVPGHWEGDLLAGSRNSYIATLVERRSRYVCLVRVRSCGH